MQRYFIKALPVLCLLFLLAFVVKESLEKPRVLILQSYSADFAWSQGFDKGIDSVLKKESYITTRHYYMDTKRHQTPQFMRKAGLAARRLIDSWHPDVIIAIDDNAQRLAAKYYIDHPTINVIFAGVNAPIEIYGYDKAKNVSGILERFNFAGVEEVLRTLFQKKTLRVWHMSDNSISANYFRKELEAHQWDNFTLINATTADTAEEWKRAVKQAQGSVDFILLSGYQAIRDAQGNLVPPKQLVSWAREGKVPVFGLVSFFLDDGGDMAAAISTHEQGHLAAKMALQVIDKKIPAGEIPVQRNRLISIHLDIPELKRQYPQIVIPITYESMSHASEN